MKNLLKILLFTVLFYTELKGQDYIFSNYSDVGYYINPALPSLVEEDINVQAKFRGQWITFAKAYKTIATSVDFSPLNNDTRYCGKKLVISPQIIQDVAGSLKMSTTSLNLNLAYSQFLDRNYRTQLMMGLQSGYTFQSVNFRNAHVGSGYFDSDAHAEFYDPTILNKSNRINLAAGAGMALYPNRNMNLSFGLAAYNLIGQNITFYEDGYSKENRRFAGYLNTNYRLNDINQLNGYLIFQMQGLFKSYTGGMSLGVNFGKQQKGEFVNKFIMGGGLRWNDAVIATLGYGNENLDITFNYDFNYSKLIKSSRSVGAFEVSFAYKTNWFKTDQSCPKPINCVTFL